MDRRAHWLLRGAAIAVLVVEAMVPRGTTAKAPTSAPTVVQSSPAPAGPSVPVAMN
jgi:hypothetical protein